MKKVIDFFLLKREAYLFDARLYILKAFFAVLTAYAIINQLPLVHKDIISALFGLMMTLEPVTVTGIRSGLKQITATLLGALTTAIVISLLGINIWTVAFSVSATLFLCLKINWREVSPVAIFTSIYMTQYVQYTTNGEPSVLLTFLLRILALCVGILIAVIYNFLFASFFYKRMEHKRIAHILRTLAAHMRQVCQGIKDGKMDQIYREKELLPGTFIGIDWLTSLIKDKEKETILRKRLHLNSRFEDTDTFQEILLDLRNITHLIYDTTYMLSYRMQELTVEDRRKLPLRLDSLIKETEYLAAHCETNITKYENQESTNPQNNLQEARFEYNIKSLEEILDRINDTLLA